MVWAPTAQPVGEPPIDNPSASSRPNVNTSPPEKPGQTASDLGFRVSRPGRGLGWLSLHPYSHPYICWDGLLGCGVGS